MQELFKFHSDKIKFNSDQTLQKFKIRQQKVWSIQNKEFVRKIRVIQYY